MTVWQYREATGYGKNGPTDKQLDTLEKRIANTKADLDAQRTSVLDDKTEKQTSEDKPAE